MRQGGAIIVDGREVADTLRCAHCGNIWVVQRGSGIKRGFCTRCMHVTCGKKECDDCLPFEKQLELSEKGIITLK